MSENTSSGLTGIGEGLRGCSQVIVLYLCLGLTLIPFGIVAFTASSQADEIKWRYDDDADCFPNQEETVEGRIKAIQNNPGQKAVCNKEIIMPFAMKAPIYVYYELEDYYQNHRRYVKSRSDDQLAGENGRDKADCKPKLYQRPPGSDDSYVIKPCGLAAWSYFNDTFIIESRTPNKNVTIDDTGIAWESDIKFKFGDYKAEHFNDIPELRGGGEIKGEVSSDEHFIVWMRTASRPIFRKLYGVINQDLEEHDRLSVSVLNLYNTYLFGGKKRLVLATTTFLGGRNHTIALAYIVSGSISLFFGVVYLLLHIQLPRDFGDEKFLSWKRKRY